MSDDFSGDDFDDVFDSLPLDSMETAQVHQDLADLDAFEQTFAGEGYVGVSILCQDCIEEHYYPWALLRSNLELLLESGEIPVHEPAYAPDPDTYIPWEYARGYVDALGDAGVHRRLQLDHCHQCHLELSEALAGANFCPRCGTSFLRARLMATLLSREMTLDEVTELLNEVGFPG